MLRQQSVIFAIFAAISHRLASTASYDTATWDGWPLNSSSTTNTVSYQITSSEEYSPAASNSYSSDDQRYLNTTTILDIKFASNFSAFNPRNPKSLFQFIESYPPLGILQDAATFLRGDDGLINMVSVPYDHWLPQSYGAAAVFQAFDTSVQLKNPIEIGADQVLTVALQFRCRTVNVKLNRFPKDAIMNAEDDPRLASCGIDLVDLDQTGIEFAIFLTNKGIWLKYSRSALARALLGTNYNAFEISRRVKSRTVYGIVNARIEIDRSVGETRYYINDKLAWTVGNWGVLTNNMFKSGKNKLVSYSAASTPVNGTQSIIPGKITIIVNHAKKLDESDPNRDNILPINGSATEFSIDVDFYSPGLVKLTNLTDFYDPDMDFYDQDSPRNSSLWGQGSISGLFSLLAQLHNPGTTTMISGMNYGQMNEINSYISQPQEDYSSGSSGAQQNQGGSYENENGWPSSASSSSNSGESSGGSSSQQNQGGNYENENSWPSSTSSSNMPQQNQGGSYDSADGWTSSTSSSSNSGSRPAATTSRPQYYKQEQQILIQSNAPISNADTLSGSLGSIADVDSGYASSSNAVGGGEGSGYVGQSKKPPQTVSSWKK